jgi:hypothetical protein
MVARAEVDKLAVACRNAYIWYRTRYEQSVHARSSTAGQWRPFEPGAAWDGDGSKPAIWPRIAERMIQLRLSPAACLDLLFTRKGTGRTPPLPLELLTNNQALLREFSEASAFFVENLKVALNSEMRRWTTLATLADAEPGTSREQVYRRVLWDDMVLLSPLFRYCISRNDGFDKLSLDFEEGALFQYRSAKDGYDQAWGSFIPTALNLRLMEVEHD